MPSSILSILSISLLNTDKKPFKFTRPTNRSVATGINSIYKVVIYAITQIPTSNKTELPFLDICPSDNNLTGAEIELVSVLARESKLKSALENIIDEYDYIIIDCPPSLGLLTVNSFNAADYFIVPLQTEYFAMEGLALLLNTIRLIKQSLNPKLEMMGILLTMYDRRNNLHKQVTNEIRGHFGKKVFQSVIPRNVKLSECPSFGKPIILYDIESRGSEAYLNLAKEVLIYEKEKARQEISEEVNEVQSFDDQIQVH